MFPPLADVLLRFVYDLLSRLGFSLPPLPI